MYLVLAVLAGVVLGAFFFGGLWWTVNRSMVSPQPALLILVSFLLRSVVAVGGFYLALQGGWQPLLACMGGFLVARALLTRIIGKHTPETASEPLRISP
ncbi:ATP synthase subunit I [Thermomonas sp.]|uniref:ATP synthase subunit I n=1 Tax=Thermomonas sp. TaxID=1971895 RepID=UPI00248A45CF|nr:ATP synthase subunit I [Thermomonas sp.]MDI1253675.1 ATP synthase subunit I [Thermomonas sp.]